MARTLKKEGGQALTELALVLPVLLLVLVLSIDVLMLGANALIAKSLTARGARAAALSTVPDGVTSCQVRVADTIGSPQFFLANWSYSTVNCSADPTVGIAQGSEVEVTIDLTYYSSWLGDLALMVATSDYGR